jgi:hypothetical protein
VDKQGMDVIIFYFQCRKVKVIVMFDYHVGREEREMVEVDVNEREVSNEREVERCREYWAAKEIVGNELDFVPTQTMSEKVRKYWDELKDATQRYEKV